MPRRFSSIDELMIYAGQVASHEVPYEPFELAESGLAIHTHIEGESWDTSVDVRLAKYVLLLQDSMDNLLEEHGTPAAFDEPLRVKVEIREGSTIPWADLAPYLQYLCTPMTPEQTFISIMTSIAAAGGYFFWARYLTSKERVAVIEQQNKVAEHQQVALTEHEQTKREMLGVLRARAENEPAKYLPYEQPAKHLVRCLEEGDTIDYGGGEIIEADVAKKMAPKRLPRTPEQVTYADGDYLLHKSVYTEGEPVLELAQGDHTIKAYVSQLDDADKKAFLDSINARLLNEELPLTLSLQVNVTHTARSLKYASIVGQGAPREGRDSKLLSQILLQV